jgi:hypothetical protein
MKEKKKVSSVLAQKHTVVLEKKSETDDLPN